MQWLVAPLFFNKFFSETILICDRNTLFSIGEESTGVGFKSSRLSDNRCPPSLSNIEPDRLNTPGWRGEGSRMGAMLIQLVIMSSRREIK